MREVVKRAGSTKLTERKMRLMTACASRTKRPSCTRGRLQSMPTTESQLTCVHGNAFQ